METKLFLDNINIAVPALLRIPDNNSRYPAVLLCHGTGSDKNEVGGMFESLAQMLEAAGIASIRMDFADCGERRGKGELQSFLGEVSDVECCYSYLASHPSVDHERIAILGFSQGGRVMAEFLGRHPNLRCAVSWSGTCHKGEGIYAGWFEEYYEQVCKNGSVGVPLAWREDIHFSVDWFDELKNTDPMSCLEQYKAPVLALSGDRDELVPCVHAQEIADAGRNPFSKACIIPGADHTFNILSGERNTCNLVLNQTLDWFRLYI